MATHVGLVEVLKVCLPFRSSMFKTLVKQRKLCCISRLHGKVSVMPMCLTNNWRICVAEVVPRSNHVWMPTLERYYHNHSTSDHDGKEEDCCCSKLNRDKFGVPCWKCGRCVDDNKERYFCACGVVQSPVTDRSLFDVLGVEETFDIDLQELTEKYRNLQRFLHPDKFSQKSDIEKEFSAQHSTLVNRAYNTLQRPLDRGLYLLRLNEDTLEHDARITSVEFLDEIMTINEDLIEAETAEEINTVGDLNQTRIDALVRRISDAFNIKDTITAKELLLRLKYYASIQEKVKELSQKIM